MNPCPICPRKYRALEPTGPTKAQYLFIGERPGHTENLRGMPFCGKAGHELDGLYLKLAQLNRCDVRVTNACLCWAEQDRTPSEREIAVCSQSHLPVELAMCNPEVVVLLGGSACRLVPGISLEMHHGIPQLATIYNWTGTVVPMFHPAAALREPRWMTVIMEDFEQLPARLRQLSRKRSVKHHEETDYRFANAHVLGMYLSNDAPQRTEMAIDTEDHGGDPFSVQISIHPGTAVMINAKDREALDELVLLAGPARSIFHNATHDIDILRRAGIRPGPSIADTMQESFHQGNLPQGLKALVFRMFGHVMTSWEDVVRPASIEALICWAVEALDVARADLSLIDVTRLKTKVRERVHKGPVEQLLDRIIRCSHDDSTYDPWSRLDAFWANPANEWMTSHIESRCKRYPILGIANAPIRRALEYACSDADWTLRVARELARRRTHSMWRIESGDEDQ